MKIDYHIHSKFSLDGEMPIKEICEKAVEIGLDEIAITDHLDIDWPDPKYNFEMPDTEKYIKEIESCKKNYQGRLIIKTGIEIGLQPHVLEENKKIIESYPFDFVIASVHIIQRMDPYQGDYFKGKTKEECYRLYYKETLDLINEYSDFDVLGHIGYIRRYFPAPYEKGDNLLHLELIKDILKVLIKKGKGIEVNTSGYKDASQSPLPPAKVIEAYKNLGGTIITIGSDAHSSDEMGFGLDAGIKAIKKSGFNYISSFTKRKPLPLPIP